MVRNAVVVIILFVLLAAQIPTASYTVTHLSTTITLNQNTSATVREVLTVTISNVSINQYAQDREALNLTLSTWQSLIGPLLVQHVINPKSGVYNFKFLPGPPTPTIIGQEQAQLLMTYNVHNATTVDEFAPRKFLYTFNPSIFNFEHGASGQVLNPNTTLTIDLPSGSRIKTIYPVPDLPIGAFAANYTNVTSVSWFYQEPLSKFTLTFLKQQSIESEVFSFFSAAYSYLGFFTYVIIAVVIIAFILYTYFKALEK